MSSASLFSPNPWLSLVSLLRIGATEKRADGGRAVAAPLMRFYGTGKREAELVFGTLFSLHPLLSNMREESVVGIFFCGISSVGT